MKNRQVSIPLFVGLLIVVLSSQAAFPIDEESLTPQSTPDLVRGASLFQEYCARCHGSSGNGKGELAADLHPRPADLASGIYKYRSTPSGMLPTDDDVFRTISLGVPGTSMSDFQDLSEKDRHNLVGYVKSLSARFTEELQIASISFPESRPASAESIAKGKKVFVQMQCAACHGEHAQGDGPLADVLSDTAGESIRPANLTKQPLKSGKAPKDIYRTVMTGLDGTPMPSYGDSLSPEDGWNLALYVFSVSERKGEE